MKKKFLKKALLIICLIIIIISLIIIYLNQIYLPEKVKFLIINSLQEKIQKKVTLESLHFSLFKGLVLKNLKVYDDAKVVVDIKEASSSFLFFPFFQKQIIISHLKVISPVIFLERRSDNTFNLPFYFKEETLPTKKKFKFFIYRISIKDGRLDFQDATLSPAFTKALDNIDLNLFLSLLMNVKFELRCEIPVNPSIKITAQGEFQIPKQQARLRIGIRDLSLKEFSGYYQHLGISVPQGLIDGLLNLEFKDKLVTANLDTKNRDLQVSFGKISGKMTSGIKSILHYNLDDRKLQFSGNADILQGELSGIEFVENIKDIKGKLDFDNSGLSMENMSANVWGIPITAKVNLANFNNPLLNLNVESYNLNLALIKEILKDRFQFNIPGDLQGRGNLSFSLQNKLLSTRQPQINGYLDISGAQLKLDQINSPFEKIQGRLEFTLNQLKWSPLNFQYLGIPYKTTGTLTDFRAPGVQLELSSRDLSLESLFAVNNQRIKLSKCSGRYLNNKFFFSGDFNFANKDKIDTDINGQLKIDLGDIKVLFPKFKTQLEQIKPSGEIDVDLSLEGDIRDLKSSFIKANLSSPQLSIYGLKFSKVSLDYQQAYGIANIARFGSTLYDGRLDATATLNLTSGDFPYRIDFNLQDLKIEKLKLDTSIKEQDIAGTIRLEGNINGYSNDLGRLTGTGQIFISDGKLWQLNLFKGIGVLLFSSDFTSIIFNEGYCRFFIRDKSVFTDNLNLKSNLAELSGQVKIGFDGALDATLDVHVADNAPLTGTFKDITTAIMGQVGRFGVIKINGTLKEPKYKFKTAVVDIIKGLKDIIFKE
jgi:hypothetical protein